MFNGEDLNMFDESKRKISWDKAHLNLSCKNPTTCKSKWSKVRKDYIILLKESIRETLINTDLAGKHI